LFCCFRKFITSVTISLCASLSASSHAVFVIRDSSCTSDVTTKPSSELPLLARKFIT